MNKKPSRQDSFISRTLLLFFCIALFNINLNAQVKVTVDTTSLKIGEQVNYKIVVSTDSTDLVVFPQGQTFLPMELVESSEIDTIRQRHKFNLIKNYALTQFDSGYYTIPPQKIVIGERIVSTDSLALEVNMIEVDTSKQGLYDIKPIIDVEKSKSGFWIYTILGLVVLAIIGGLLYWFVWRKKPLTKEEREALLPPYDRAKLALKKLDESHYLERSELKPFYSELTLAIRRYLDEKVYDHSLESTTDQLIFRLNLLREGNQIDLSLETIKNLESILKRADLVKFAKSAPDLELAKMDRSTIDHEIDHVKEALPEPTEEEKLLNEQYRKRQEQRKKQWKIIVTVATLIVLLNITFIGFGLKYGFKYVFDTVVGNDNLELLEGEWVESAYGVPPIYISTPEVLERVEIKRINEIDTLDNTVFTYGNLHEPLYIKLATTNVKPKSPQAQGEKPSLDLRNFLESNLQYFENNGVNNIITKTEKFTTPNAQEGVKVFGTAQLPSNNLGETTPGQYVILGFTAENVVQEIVLTWHANNEYAGDIMKRVIDSIELKKPEEDDEGN